MERLADLGVLQKRIILLLELPLLRFDIILELPDRLQISALLSYHTRQMARRLTCFIFSLSSRANTRSASSPSILAAIVLSLFSTSFSSSPAVVILPSATSRADSNSSIRAVLSKTVCESFWFSASASSSSDLRRWISDSWAACVVVRASIRLERVSRSPERI